MLPHGIEVQNLTKKNPGNGLPDWVRADAESRGYGDAKEPLSLFISEDDINSAFEAIAHGNGAACVMAQAGSRLGAKSVYFYRTTAWVDFGVGPIVRYETSEDIYNHVIRPFDKGDKKSVRPGIYHLKAPRKGQSLASKRLKDERKRQNPYTPRPGAKKPRPYMGRVVMAVQPNESAPKRKAKASA